MMEDPIVAEVRRARDEYAKKFNYDLWAMYEDLKRREKIADRPVVDRSNGAGRGERSRTSRAAALETRKRKRK